MGQNRTETQAQGIVYWTSGTDAMNSQVRQPGNISSKINSVTKRLVPKMAVVGMSG
ncbi:hypothetical protein GCM10025794_32490 [Massilia kyonggiensis]